jgi:hypothetical protein
MRLAGHVARLGEKRNAYRLLVGRPGAQVYDNLQVCEHTHKEERDSFQKLSNRFDIY